MTWTNYSRACVRCGKPGPRIFDVVPGYVHYYCLTDREKRERRILQTLPKKEGPSDDRPG